jgi:tol-pal system protein YbgF
MKAGFVTTRIWLTSVACGAIAAMLLTTPLGAQTQPRANTKQAAPQAKAPTTEAPATDSARGDNALRQRVEQLEEQLVDMQVVIGTLESLAKGGAQSSSGVFRGGSAGAGGGADDPRVGALELQVRSLTSQVEQLTQQLRTQGGSAGRGQVASASGSVLTPPVAPGGFGSTTIDRDPIGQILSPGQGSTPTPSLPQAGAADASPKQLYEVAYGHLLQQDYASAEASFDEFLKRFPNDQLAGNAQYWLGESFFVRGQFKAAANSFLKGYQAYSRSSKAPDSLLKLAMSLDRLGQRDAACSSYLELNVKFPNAPGNVKSRADNERRRLGCA